MYCSGCGKQIHETATACPNCGALQSAGAIPDGIRGWSWGAFLLNWIWAIGNRTWIGLLALIPYGNIVIAIILGIKGREWAWKNKKWESVEHFNRVQRKWSIWGGIILLVGCIAGVAFAVLLPSHPEWRTAVGMDSGGATPGNFKTESYKSNFGD